MKVQTNTEAARAAQRETFDRILANRMLYCTVCDNNNGNCTIHNTTKMFAVERPDQEFDLHLNNGNLLEHFHEGEYDLQGGRHSQEDARCGC